MYELKQPIVFSKLFYFKLQKNYEKFGTKIIIISIRKNREMANILGTANTIGIYIMIE